MKKRIQTQAKGWLPHFRLMPIFLWLAPIGICLSGQAQAQAQATSRESQILGQELRDLEQTVTGETRGQSDDSPPVELFSADNVEPMDGRETVKIDSDREVAIGRIIFRGDRDWIEETGIGARARDALVGRMVSDAESRKIIEGFQQELISRGYYLTTLWAMELDPENGVLTILVDSGRVGEMNFRFFDRAASGEFTADGEGRFFTNRQLERRMRRTQSGEVFNYFNFYDDIYAINVHPDLIVDTDFHVRSRVEDDLLRREIDMNFSVEEKRPVHGVVSLNNFGSEATDNWQVEFTVQHLNLTKRDDILTLRAPFSIDFQSLVSGAGSYSIPYYAGKGGRVTAYGGYSSLDARGVVEQIDVKGTGWFSGLQWSHNLLDTKDHFLSGGLGIVRRYVDDQLVVAGFSTKPRDAVVMPASLALSYTKVSPDILGGRSMGTLQLLYNQGDFLGTSSDSDVRTLRPVADADYMIARIQLARIQPLWGRLTESGERTSQWVLFSRLESQFADGALIPAEQVGIGGHRSVRGYEEYEFFGDDGGFVNLELRTPLMFGPFTRIFSREWAEDSQQPKDRLQGVLFTDVGYVRTQNALPSEEKDQFIYSAGLGLRFAVSERAQFRADWGFPLEETVESSPSGRGHLEFQVQF